MADGWRDAKTDPPEFNVDVWVWCVEIRNGRGFPDIATRWKRGERSVRENEYSIQAGAEYHTADEYRVTHWQPIVPPEEGT